MSDETKPYAGQFMLQQITKLEADLAAVRKHEHSDYVTVCVALTRAEKENARLRKRETAWKTLVDGKDGLLAAYRIRRPPSETTWKKLERAKKALEKTEEVD